MFIKKISMPLVALSLLSAQPLLASDTTIEWEKNPGHTQKFRTVTVPFDVDSVITHANTFPENYKMDFLESKKGKVLILNVIEQLNAGMKPKNFDTLITAWNKSRPSAGYNKSLIADFVSCYAPKAK